MIEESNCTLDVPVVAWHSYETGTFSLRSLVVITDYASETPRVFFSRQTETTRHTARGTSVRKKS